MEISGFYGEVLSTLGFSRYEYRRPIDLPSYKIYSSPESHKGVFQNAIDIAVPDPNIQKTVVFSPISGVIEGVTMGNTVWGPTEDFRLYLNFVNIRPSSQSLEFVEVAHLAPFVDDIGNEKILKVGDRVTVGEPIATVGINGWTTRDGDGKPTSHVHIMVGQWKDGARWGKRNNFKSLKIRWMKGLGLA